MEADGYPEASALPQCPGNRKGLVRDEVRGRETGEQVVRITQVRDKGVLTTSSTRQHTGKEQGVLGGMLGTHNPAANG